jgi:hypothetical protein
MGMARMSDPRELFVPPGDPPEMVPDDGAEAPLAVSVRPEPPAEVGSEELEVEFQKVYRAVQRALQMASYLPAEPPGVTRVAVVSGQGQLIASAALDSPSQARFVLDQLHPLGFEERGSTEAIQKLGCDLLLVHAARLEVGQVQGIVRGLDSERWPPES